MAVRITDPTDDPKLPSFRHPVLREIDPDLKVAHDCWEMLRGDLIRDYLPKEEAEPTEAYKGRIGRAAYQPRYRQAIEGFTGVLTRFQLNNPPISWEDYADDIDLEGNSVEAFWAAADALALRDGACLITVEMPPGSEASRAEELASGRRPYLTLHQRSNVINWRMTNVDGVEVPQRVTVLELAEVDDGDYGVKTEVRYRVHEAGGWRLLKIEQSPKGLASVVELESGEYLDSDQQPLPFPPVCWYSVELAGFGKGGLPLRQLALMSIEHLQKRSDLTEKTRRCAMPVAVRTGVVPDAPGARSKPVVLGPNTIVDLPPGGTFAWEEPSASSLAEQRSQLAELEEQMRDATVQFVQGSSAKTATQAGLEATQTQASMKNIARQKNNAIQRCMALWSLFTGDDLLQDAGIMMSPTIYDRPLDAADVTQLSTMEAAGQLSRQSFLEEMIKGGRLTVVTSAEQELERQREEMRRLDKEVEEEEPPAPSGEELAMEGEDEVPLLPGEDEITGED